MKLSFPSLNFGASQRTTRQPVKQRHFIMKTGKGDLTKTTVHAQETNGSCMRVVLREDRIGDDGIVNPSMTTEYGYVKTLKVTGRGENKFERERSVVVFCNHARKIKFFFVCSADQKFSRTGQTIMLDAVPRKYPTPSPNSQEVTPRSIDGFRCGFEFQDIGNAISVATWLCNCGFVDIMAQRVANDPFERHLRDCVDSRAKEFDFPRNTNRVAHFQPLNYAEIKMILETIVVRSNKAPVVRINETPKNNW